MPREARGSFRSALVAGLVIAGRRDRTDESVRASAAPLSSITDLSRDAPPFATDEAGGTGTGMAPMRAQATNEATISSPGGYTSATRSPR